MKFDNYTLRLINIEDLPQYFNLIDRNRNRFIYAFTRTSEATRTVEAAENYLREIIKKAEAKRCIPYVVIDDRTNEIIAWININSIDWSIPKGELGYFVDENYEGKGIITRSLSLIIEVCFNELQFNKLCLRCHEKNIGSRRVAEKNGFKQEGLIRCDYKAVNGELLDMIYYGLVNPKIEL